ncbi:3' terminal RNA ribose 2'-O-methyltransferase Hen1 [Arthrobacter alpinus]|uniref:Small RNA 2'-O-methyltransferase n=1 Tax=Arthrobacter alpinus TaxID=656366 RepID=A0A0S2M425_9MICC|nr:3' terminal RNA ribose 2'-O-methyltransferase Hen1 [Arthrobacter alpinus]ALO68272.1 3' terminal RNA ribose 2'-O-methyltransferase Hen1 [Arthrobacter alpinus]
MLVTITYIGPDASDLGYLLHKKPGKVQPFDLNVGIATVFYPEVTPKRCTAALLVEVDAIDLVRNKHIRTGTQDSLDHYINDRPYVSSSLMSVALGKVFSTAMSGRCNERPELAASPLQLVIQLSSVSVSGEPGFATSLFEPLGWRVNEVPIPLDSKFPNWGDSAYVKITLTGTMPLNDALRQIYLLLPVMEDAKHYWVSDDEVEKLMRAGAGWLETHPQREIIIQRYLAHQRGMTEKVGFLINEEGEIDTGEPAQLVPARKALRSLRVEAVLTALDEVGARRVVDMGCGEGALLQKLFSDPTFSSIVGTDVSPHMLNRAEERLGLRELSDRQKERVRLLQSSATYLDDRLRDYDAVVLMEVVEHIEPERLAALENSVFGYAQPKTVVVTTPNAEFNSLYPLLPSGSFRHPDHRFEWTRAEFDQWIVSIASTYGYSAERRSIGDADEHLGPPTQMAIFRKA